MRLIFTDTIRKVLITIYIKIVCEPTLGLDVTYYDACACGGDRP